MPSTRTPPHRISSAEMSRLAFGSRKAPISGWIAANSRCLKARYCGVSSDGFCSPRFATQPNTSISPASPSRDWSACRARSLNTVGIVARSSKNGVQRSSGSARSASKSRSTSAGMSSANVRPLPQKTREERSAVAKSTPAMEGGNARSAAGDRPPPLHAATNSIANTARSKRLMPLVCADWRGRVLRDPDAKSRYR